MGDEDRVKVNGSLDYVHKIQSSKILLYLEKMQKDIMVMAVP